MKNNFFSLYYKLNANKRIDQNVLKEEFTYICNYYM